MNKYELAVVLSAKLEEDERTAADAGKKRLAYEIQKMREAYYYFIKFESESTTPAEVENAIRIMEEVVRFLCVREDED